MLSYERYHMIVLQLSPKALYKSGLFEGILKWQNNPPDISDDLHNKLPSNNLACGKYINFMKNQMSF